MKLLLQEIISFLACPVIVLLAAGCLGVVAWKFCRWLPTVELWRLRRSTITALMAVAVVAAILAQKGDRGTGVPPGTTPQTGTTGVQPVEGELTNTLHFAAIDVHSNGTATLAVAWPAGLMDTSATLDLFAATSIVDSVWVWQCGHQVAAGDTNWIVTVALPEASPGTNAPSAFFYVSNRETCADTMDDFDGDGLPDAYELAHGTNPYVADYSSALKLTVGPGGSFSDIQSALAASADYSIIELDPSARHEITDLLGVRLPQHPVMVTASNSYAVVRAAGTAAFMLATNTTAQTMFKNLYLLLDAKNSFQVGFWCGGNLPWDGNPAAAMFDNVYVRMPNPDVQYRGWIFYRHCADLATIRNCTVNAAGATWAIGIDAYGSPPLAVDRCSFVNFPPDSASDTGCGILLRTAGSSDEGSEVTISRSLFDESFTNAWPLARFDTTNSYSVAISDCLTPCDLPPDYLPDISTNITVTSAMLTWSGIPHSYSPSVALGIGSLMPIVNDQSADTDGDGLCDYEEAYDLGIDPFNADSDNDGVYDGTEVNDGTDPADPHFFKQRLTISVTNTVSLAHTVYTAWGYSEDGWESNGLAAFPQGCGTNLYVDASSQGAMYIKTFCDLNGNGEYDAAYDILLVRPIPSGGAVHVSFTFGDVDGDGVTDEQERQEGTDPYDSGNFRLVTTVNLVPCGVSEWLTNHVAWGYSYFGWEANGLTAFNGTNLLFSIDQAVTNGELYVKVFRDINTNGVYDTGIDELYRWRLTNADNGKTATLHFGDSDGNTLPDWWETQEGLDDEGVARRAYDDPDGDGLINLHEYWCGMHPLVPDGSNTLLSVASRAIDDRIRDIDPSTAIPRFVNYFVNGSNGVFQLNTNFWARDLDLSCVSVWHNGDHKGTKAATLITRKHVVLAQHWWNYGNGYTFCDTNGNVYVRFLSRSENISDDLRLGQLNEPLPDSFRPASVMSTNYVRYLSTGKYLPTLCLNQTKAATVLELEDMNCRTLEKGVIWHSQYGQNTLTNYVSTQRNVIRGATPGGDSGSPVFLVVGNELILLFSKHLGSHTEDRWYWFWGPMLPFRLESIQNKINEWEGTDAGQYQIVPFDLSSFGEIINH